MVVGPLKLGVLCAQPILADGDHLPDATAGTQFAEHLAFNDFALSAHIQSPKPKNVKPANLADTADHSNTKPPPVGECPLCAPRIPKP
ncbi:protein of unknown function [Azospirillum baldaniorum]|uniref:Uncharacterized protein n=1 Tax=Azospirillum baldaniorum TaxID=1064539 RepID=A0A9P1NLX7_9PROT|nr:protein of unknown function [Azospirillum baldaniorum]